MFVSLREAHMRSLTWVSGIPFNSQSHIGRFCYWATRLLNEGACVLQRFIGLCGIQPSFPVKDLKSACTFSTNWRLCKGNRQTACISWGRKKINIMHFRIVFRRVRKIAKCFVISVRPSVRLSTWNNSAHTGRILMKFDIHVFCENLSRKFSLH